MRILAVSNFYPPEFRGGYELVCQQMVDELISRGHEVRVITTISAHAGDDSERHIDRVLQMPQMLFSPTLMDALGHDVGSYLHGIARTVNLANVRALSDELQEFRPDVVYLCNLLGLGGMGVLALLRHQGVPWVWQLGDRTPAELCYFAETRQALTREFPHAFPGRYVACSGHVLGEVAAFGVDIGPSTEVIPNWVHGERPPLRSRYFDGGVLKIMGVSGTLCEPKGTHILIETVGLLRAAGLSNLQLDLYGNEDDPQWRKMIHQHGVEGLVRIMGPRTHAEIQSLCRQYDLFAFPTWSREPFGLVALESAVAGCVPLITADCGVAEWLIDEVDCLKAPRSADAFARRITQIIRREIDFAGIARRGQRTVWEYFHISAVAPRIEGILEEAAADAQAPQGSPSEFFTLARFAEGLTQTLILEAG